MIAISVYKTDFIKEISFFYKNIDDMKNDIFMFQMFIFLMMIFFIFIGLGSIEEITYHMYLDQRAKFIQFKIQGCHNSEIAHIFKNTALILCLFTGILSYCGSALVSVILSQSIISEIFNNVVMISPIECLKYSLNPLFLAICIIFSLIVGRLSIRKPMRFIKAMNLETTSFRRETKLTKLFRNFIGKWKNISLLISLYPLIFFIINNSLNLDRSYFLTNFFYAIGLFLAYLLLPFSLFAIPFLSIRMISTHGINLYETLYRRYSESRISNNWFNVMLFPRKKVGDQIHLKTLTSLGLLSCMFLFSLTQIYINEDYSSRKDLFLNLNGDFASFKLGSKIPIMDLMKTIDDIEKNVDGNLNFSNFTWQISSMLNTNEMNLERSEISSLRYLNFDQMYNQNLLSDNWLINKSWTDVFANRNDENFLLCPDIMRDLGYKENMEISINIHYNNTNIIQNMSIAGFYSIFPLTPIYKTSEGISFSNSILVNGIPPNFLSVDISQFDLVFYDVQGPKSSFFTEIKQIFLGNENISEIWISFENKNTYEWSVFQFQLYTLDEGLQIFQYFVYFLILLLLILNFLAQYMLKSQYLQLWWFKLQILGVTKSQLFILACKESIFFLVFGLIQGIFGIISSVLFTLFLNQLNFSQISFYNRHFVFPMEILGYILYLFLGLFVLMQISNWLKTRSSKLISD